MQHVASNTEAITVRSQFCALCWIVSSQILGPDGQMLELLTLNRIKDVLIAIYNFKR